MGGRGGRRTLKEVLVDSPTVGFGDDHTGPEERERESQVSSRLCVVVVSRCEAIPSPSN